MSNKHVAGLVLGGAIVGGAAYLLYKYAVKSVNTMNIDEFFNKLNTKDSDSTNDSEDYNFDNSEGTYCTHPTNCKACNNHNKSCEFECDNKSNCANHEDNQSNTCNCHGAGSKDILSMIEKGIHKYISEGLQDSSSQRYAGKHAEPSDLERKFNRLMELALSMTDGIPKSSNDNDADITYDMQVLHGLVNGKYSERECYNILNKKYNMSGEDILNYIKDNYKDGIRSYKDILYSVALRHLSGKFDDKNDQ